MSKDVNFKELTMQRHFALFQWNLLSYDTVFIPLSMTEMCKIYINVAH